MREQANGSFALFGEVSFNAVTQASFQRIKEEIETEDQAYLLNVNADSYLQHIVERFRIAALTIDLEHPTESSREEARRAERFDIYSGRNAGESYRHQVITYHLRFSGDPALLRYQPNPSSIGGHRGYVRDEDICFDVVDQRGIAQEIETRAKSTLESISLNLGHLLQNINSFNQALVPLAKRVFDARRLELQRRLGVVEALRIPFKRSGTMPPTLAVPVARKQIPAPRPPASMRPYRRDWALDESIYQDILQTIHDTGRVFERLPSTYAGKDEETLRDHLILQLEPHFEWSSTTSETFNKQGKTDILIRYEKEIVFVAECKFWRGRKQHFETIDQILKYLTWRESKTAIVYFIDTKEVSAPLRAIQDSTPEHPCFVSFKDRQQESRFNYEFHLPGDEERTVRTAMLCFHLPKP